MRLGYNESESNKGLDVHRIYFILCHGTNREDVCHHRESLLFNREITSIVYVFSIIHLDLRTPENSQEAARGIAR